MKEQVTTRRWHKHYQGSYSIQQITGEVQVNKGNIINSGAYKPLAGISRKNGSTQVGCLTDPSTDELPMSPCSHCKHFYIMEYLTVTSVENGLLPSCSQGHNVITLGLFCSSLPSLS